MVLAIKQQTLEYEHTMSRFRLNLESSSVSIAQVFAPPDPSRYVLNLDQSPLTYILALSWSTFGQYGPCLFQSFVTSLASIIKAHSTHSFVLHSRAILTGPVAAPHNAFVLDTGQNLAIALIHSMSVSITELLDLCLSRPCVLHPVRNTNYSTQRTSVNSDYLTTRPITLSIIHSQL